jgi:hypothetical protein
MHPLRDHLEVLIKLRHAQLLTPQRDRGAPSTLRVRATVICDRDQELIASLEGGGELLNISAERGAPRGVEVRARPARV